MENENKMNISIGTGNLGESYNPSYQEAVNYCISKIILAYFIRL